jgi:hypothetical protein
LKGRWKNSYWRTKNHIFDCAVDWKNDYTVGVYTRNQRWDYTTHSWVETPNSIRSLKWGIPHQFLIQEVVLSKGMNNKLYWYIVKQLLWTTIESNNADKLKAASKYTSPTQPWLRALEMGGLQLCINIYNFYEWIILIHGGNNYSLDQTMQVSWKRIENIPHPPNPDSGHWKW